MFEIELKARVRDREAVAARLSALGEPAGSVIKDDVYWELGGVRARIRTETQVGADGAGSGQSRSLLTYKRKETRGGLEVNDELECEVGDGAVLSSLLSDAGFRVATRKRKAVTAWRVGGITAELCDVPPLGLFLELEILAEDGSEATVAEARGRLSALLGSCGLSEADVEPRYYSELLSEAARDD